MSLVLNCRGTNLQEFYVEKCGGHKCKPDAIVTRVLDSKHSNEVTDLDFSSNYLGSVGLRALFDTLHGCQRLQSISFEANYLKSDAIPPLVALVNSLPVCTAINLSKNTTLGFTAANHLMNMIKSHNKLLHLDVTDTGIAKGTQDQIQLLLEENRGNAAKLGTSKLSAILPPTSSPGSGGVVTTGGGGPSSSSYYAPPTLSTHTQSAIVNYPQYTPYERARTPPHNGSPNSSPTRGIVSVNESPYGFEPGFSSDLQQSRHTTTPQYQQFMNDPTMNFGGGTASSLLPVASASRDGGGYLSYDKGHTGGSSLSSTAYSHPVTSIPPSHTNHANHNPNNNNNTSGHLSSAQKVSKADYDEQAYNRQQPEVVKGKAPVVQHEERTLDDYSKLSEKCSAKRDDFRSRHAKGLELLEQFDSNSSWPYATSCGTKQLIDELQLCVPFDEVDSFQKQGGGNYGPTAIHNMFDEVSDFTNPRRKITSLVEELKKMSKVCAPGTENLAEVVAQLYELLQGENATVDTIKEHLSQTDHKVPALLAKIDQIDNARELAVRDEDMEKAESCHDSSLRALEDVLDLILARLAIKNKGAPTHTLERLTEIEEYFQKLVAPLQPHCDELVTKINHDCQALDTKKVDEQRKLEEVTTQHRHYQRRAKEFFQENTIKHNALWADIQTQYDKLKQYGEERYNEIEVWIQETEKHERVKAECDQVGVAIEKHKKTLSSMMEQVKLISTIINQYEGVINKGCQEVHKKAEHTNMEIEGIALQEHKRHYEVFRRYYLTLGELIYKKEKRSEEIERFLRTIDLQISISADTLDPHVQRHREFKKELERTKHTCKVKLDMLRENGSKAAEDFSTITETPLHQAGIKIVSPLIELQEQNLARRSQLLQKVRLVVDADRADIDQESTGIEEMTQHAKQARLAGRPGLLPPLSPSPPPAKWKH